MKKGFIFGIVIVVILGIAYAGWTYLADDLFTPDAVYDANGTLISGEDLAYEAEYVAETNAKRSRAFQLVFWGIVLIVILLALYVTSYILEHVYTQRMMQEHAQESEDASEQSIVQG